MNSDDENRGTPLRLIVAGSRDITDTPLVHRYINEVCVAYPTLREIVEVGATGVDRSARLYAFENDMDLCTMHAEWGRFKRSAGPLRNKRMAAYGDILLAVWDGKSRGTQHMIMVMKQLGKPTIVHTVEPS
jgi:hypothetical protein